MLRKADPVKAYPIGQLYLLEHLLHHAPPQSRLKQPGRRRPACFIYGRYTIGGPWQEGSFHSDDSFQGKEGSKHKTKHGLFLSLFIVPPETGQFLIVAWYVS